MKAKNNTSCIVLQLQPHTHSQHCFKPCYYFIIRTCSASLQTVDPTYPALVPFRDFDPGTDAARIETAIKTKGKGSWLGGYAFSSGTFGFFKALDRCNTSYCLPPFLCYCYHKKEPLLVPML